MVAIPKKCAAELTGRARVRPGWRGRLVLQVEVKTTIYSACPPRPGRDANQWREQMKREGEQSLHWRDAAWQDMHALDQRWHAHGGTRVEAPANVPSGNYTRPLDA